MNEVVKNWVIKHETKDLYWNASKKGGWDSFENATRYSSKDLAYSLPLYGKWVNLDAKTAAQQKKADLVKLKMIVDQKADTPEAKDKVRADLAKFIFGDDAKVV